MKERRIQAGQSVTFRLPVDTPPQVIEFLNTHHPTKKRSAVLAELVICAAQDHLADDGDRVVLHVPALSSGQREWLLLPETRRMLGALVAALLQNPTGAAAIISGRQPSENAQSSGHAFQARSDFHARLARSNFEDDE